MPVHFLSCWDSSIIIIVAPESDEAVRVLQTHLGHLENVGSNYPAAG